MEISVKFNLLLLSRLEDRLKELDFEILEFNNENLLLIESEIKLVDSEEILRRLMVVYFTNNDKISKEIQIVDKYFTLLKDKSFSTDLRFLDAFNNFYESGYRSICFLNLYKISLIKHIDRLSKIKK